jgi:hypothetical protein
MKTAGLFLIVLAAAGAARAQDVLSCGYAPGWEPTGAKRSYVADSLFDYKDGGAEGYLAFGFTRMTGIDCKRGADTLTIDISEMTDADAAYGMFTANRDPNLPTAPIGMGGQMQKQSASFAKGKYYVEIVAIASSPETDETAVLKPFVAAIEHRLEGRTSLPETLSWFPAQDLAAAGLTPESVLGLRLLKRGYVAKYKQGQAFIVLEASPEAAADVLKKLRARFDGAVDAKAGDEAFQVKAQYLGGLCFFRKGSYLGGYANLPDSAAAVALAVQLAARIP